MIRYTFPIRKLLCKGCLILCCILCSQDLYAQVDSTITLTFDFNEHEIKEKDNKVLPEGVSVLLVPDRFGNEKSAVYTQGHYRSYLTLGNSPLLKNHIISISLWLNIERRVYDGKGFDCNPIIGTRNAPGEDFTNAYAMAYQSYSGRIGINSTKDSIISVNINSLKPIVFNKWYHLVYMCSDEYLALYLNGELQNRSKKNFRTQFFESDPVFLGNSMGVKNSRYTMGTFDDIKIYHRLLSDQEIYDLYHAPNPNRFEKLFQDFLKYGSIILILIMILILLIILNKRKLRKQKEQFGLINRITELELKVVKAQINPHFISNCLAAIQDLIYKNKIEKAGQYIARFSFFLRQVLNYSDKNYISLSEEIGIIRLNIELEQLRFKNEFRFELQLDDAVDKEATLIPSLITQSFIENAIWHGLLPLQGIRPPVLKIAILRRNLKVVIEIEDNGIGRGSMKKKGEESKGTQLVFDKIESLNRLSEENRHRIVIVDLMDEQQNPAGTKVIIEIDDTPE